LLGTESESNISSNTDLIWLVPVKAAAGYAAGYTDTHEVEELPGIRFPGLSGHNHRAFELAGDSMLPLASGTVVVGRKVERLQDVRLGRTYILVTLSEGIVYKRVYESPNGEHLLRLHSDNPLYTPYDVAKSEITEAWQAIMYMSSVFPDPLH
jgi:phage repressor protein C with HTH and peptisase S24 domain